MQTVNIHEAKTHIALYRAGCSGRRDCDCPGWKASGKTGVIVTSVG
ncbi:MAG: hypothetical protein PHR94_04040 [Methylomonas lenta]|nr:hypothetical protein [Methylomonas lenta]